LKIVVILKTLLMLPNSALLHLVAIVRGADTNRNELSKPSAGFLSASLGFSGTYRDNLQQLKASLYLFDTLYLWCRDATVERHDWQTKGGRK